MSARRILALLACLTGLAAAGLLLWGTGETALWGCPTQGCHEAAQSVWGSMLGISLTQWGVAFWGLALILVLLFPGWGMTAFWAALGGVFSLGLIWAQFKAQSFCPWCSVSAAAAVLLMLLALSPLRDQKKSGFEVD